MFKICQYYKTCPSTLTCVNSDYKWGRDNIDFVYWRNAPTELNHTYAKCTSYGCKDHYYIGITYFQYIMWKKSLKVKQ